MERDHDGLRSFVYDWRGLPLAVAHRLWDADWQNAAAPLYTDADEAPIPSAPRDTLPATTWLSLPSLAEPTTVTATTSYDAAGMPAQHEVDRGTGAGYEIVVQDTAYDARGPLTAYQHGNGVLCTRTYDPDTERLTRIFARKPGGGGASEVRFQDLAYAYDPVGNPVQITDGERVHEQPDRAEHADVPIRSAVPPCSGDGEAAQGRDGRGGRAGGRRSGTTCRTRTATATTRWATSRRTRRTRAGRAT